MEEKQSENTGAQEKNQFVRYDEYWLQKARTSIDNLTLSLSNRLESLNKFLNYLVAGTFLGLGGITFTAFLESTKWHIFLIFILPLIFIGIAKYKVSVVAGELEFKETDMRSPTQINDAFFKSIKVQSAHVKNAASYVGMATTFTLICFPLAIFLQNLEDSNEIPETYFSVTTDSDKKVFLHGSLPEIESLSVILYGKDLKKVPKPPVYTDILLQEKGHLNTTIDLKKISLLLDSLELSYETGSRKSNHRFTFPNNNKGTSSVTEKKQTKDSTKLKSNE